MPIEEGNIAFISFPVVAGSPASVAAKLDDIAAETGVAGMLFSWPDFVRGVRDFGAQVRPLMRCG